MIHAAFEIARESVTAEQAAAYYGVAVNDRHRAKCPFHHGQDYNLSFKNGVYHCFVCDSGGDSISFTQQLFGYTRPLDGLRRLNSDFNLGLELSGDAPPKTDYSALHNVRKKTAARELLETVGYILWDFLLNLEWIVRELAPKEPGAESDLWVFAVCNASIAEYRLGCFEAETDAEKLKWILKNKEALSQYERFNGIIEHFRK